MSFFGASASAGASSVPSASSGCPVLRVQVAAARLRAGAELGICASQEHAKEVKLPFIWLVQVQSSLDSVPVSTIERGDKIE